MASYEEIVSLYNQTCDLIECNGSINTIEHQLNTCINSLRDFLIPFDSTISTLLSRSLVLLGQLIEWRDYEQAKRCYEEAIEVGGDTSEGHLQLARCIWKKSSTWEEWKIVEDHLIRSIQCAESCEGDDVAQESKQLLARLYCQSKRGPEAYQLLHSMGFKFALSAAMSTGLSLQPSTLQRSRRQQQHIVCVYDDVLPNDLFNYVVSLFSPSSIFWTAHRYDSPSTGFFSYQHQLCRSPLLVDSSAPFDIVLHHIWGVVCEGMPSLRRARYAEWWAHSRPHCNGHKLHYDYVYSNGKVKHPIASCVTFVTADCGGSTLVLDETISQPYTSRGYLVNPKVNRCVCFRGSQLHCVLPGSGPSPSKDAKRTTFMIAFWEEDPKAKHFPITRGGESGITKLGRKPPNSRVRSNKDDRHSWIDLFSSPLDSTQKCDEAAGDKVDPRFGSYATMRNDDAVICVDDVAINLDDVCGVNTSTTKRKRFTMPRVSLLDDNVFAHFDALNSGLVLAETGVCSLNCGGTCDECRDQSRSNSGSRI